MWAVQENNRDRGYESSMYDIRRQMTNTLRSSKIQELIMEKRKGLLRKLDERELSSKIDQLGKPSQKFSVDENDNLILSEDLAKMEGILKEMDAPDIELQISRQLKRISLVLGNSTRIRDDDLDYLANRSEGFFNLVHLIFKNRMQDYSWWQQTVHILLYFSYLLNRDENLYIFTKHRLVGLLVDSIRDLPVAGDSPDYSTIVESNIYGLLTLGNIVWQRNEEDTRHRSESVRW